MPALTGATAIFSRLSAAKTTRERVTHDPVPVYDQLTQYVYQSGVEESKDGLRVRVAVGTVVPDKEPIGEMLPGKEAEALVGRL